MLKRLRLKFIAINMTIVTLMLGVIFGLSYHFTRQELENRSLDMMRTIAADPFHTGRPGDSADGQLQLPYFTVLLSGSGDIITVGGGYYDLSDEGHLRSLVAQAQSAALPTGVLEEYGLRFLRLTMRQQGCIVFADISSEQATLSGLARTHLFLGAAAFVVFLLISVLLSRWAVKPVEKAWQQQKQFVADASHELKTPLTVITANAELLQEQGYTPQERARFSAGILTMSQQMRSLVEQLLELARADSGQSARPLAPVALSTLAEQALLPFEPLFFERALTLERDIAPDLTVSGDEDELAHMLAILLDNAGKYADCPGFVRVTLERRGRRTCRLTVANTGAAIPKEECAHIFKRFYRADSARHRDGSFGLGLPIAEAIVKRHHGRIWAESEGGWNRFCVELPLK